MLQADSATPLYEQIANDIREQVAAGRYQQNEALPSEVKLCELYGVSRVTVRKAISELVDQGVVIKKHGKGTFITSHDYLSSLYKFQGFSTICQRNRIPVRSHILSLAKETASPEDLVRLGLGRNEYVIHLERLRYADHVPVLIEQVRLPYEKYPFLMNIDMENLSLYKVIEQHTGHNPEDFCDTRITLETAPASDREATLLEMDQETPVFIQEETVVSKEDHIPIHWTRQIMRGDCFKFYLIGESSRLEIKKPLC